MLRTETKLEHLAESRSCSPALGRGSTPLQWGERMSYNLFVILLSKLWVVFLWTMSISILQPMECPIKVILQEGLGHQTLYVLYVLFTSFDEWVSLLSTIIHGLVLKAPGRCWQQKVDQSQLMFNLKAKQLDPSPKWNFLEDLLPDTCSSRV